MAVTNRKRSPTAPAQVRLGFGDRKSPWVNATYANERNDRRIRGGSQKDALNTLMEDKRVPGRYNNEKTNSREYGSSSKSPTLHK